jgi:hypothetical protein
MEFIMGNNLVVPPQVNAPAYLAAFNQQSDSFTALANAAASGISTSAHPRISIKGSRFRLQSPGNDDIVLQQLYLEVIIVGAGAHLSKTYYAGAYDPNASEPLVPECWSDNGVGPSIGASNPQSATCAACHANVLGSKISPTGGKLKLCTDNKKIAVLLNDIPGVIEQGYDGAVYELRMPYMSAKNFTTYAQDLIKRGMNIATVITCITFSETSEYPNLQFRATNWVSEAQANSVLSVVDSSEVATATGGDDVVQENVVVHAVPQTQQAPAQTFAQPQQTFAQPVQQAPVQTFAQPVQQAPVQTFAQPQQTFAQPVQQAPVQTFQQPQQTFSPQAPVFPQGLTQAAQPKRHRRTKAEIAVDNAAQQPQQVQPQPQAQQVQPTFAQPQQDLPGAGANAAAASVTAPVVSDAALDNVLAQALR